VVDGRLLADVDTCTALDTISGMNWFGLSAYHGKYAGRAGTNAVLTTIAFVIVHCYFDHKKK